MSEKATNFAHRNRGGERWIYKSCGQSAISNVKSVPEWLNFRFLKQKRWILFASFNNYVYICHTFEHLSWGR